MTISQLKLAAIRARLNGVWDHPALHYFGPLSDTETDIRRILDSEIPANHVALIDSQMEESATA